MFANVLLVPWRSSVDDLKRVNDLERYIEASQAVLILLGAPAYLTSRNCLREARAARATKLPLVRVHDADTSKGGAPLERLEIKCPRDLEEWLFPEGQAPIPWHRGSDFQRLVLASVAEELLLASPEYAVGRPSISLFIEGGVAWMGHWIGEEVCLYVSPDNPACSEAIPLGSKWRKVESGKPTKGNEITNQKLAQALRTRSEVGSAFTNEQVEGFQLIGLKPDSFIRVDDQYFEQVGAICELQRHLGKLQLVDSILDATHSLLFLTPTCFQDESGERLADHVVKMMETQQHEIVMLFSPEQVTDFREIIEATPQKLVEAGLYNSLAIEWHQGLLGAVSVGLVAQALGAQATGCCTRACESVSTCMKAIRVERVVQTEHDRARLHGLSQLSKREGLSKNGHAASLTHEVLQLPVEQEMRNLRQGDLTPSRRMPEIPFASPL